MVLVEEEKKAVKITNSKMDYLHKESLYLDHRPCGFQTVGCKHHSEKYMKKSNFLCRDSVGNFSEYSTFFPSKGYSNVSSSILSYIVGGFVGSKSQMNNNKKHIVSYDLSAAISNLLNSWKSDHEKASLKRNNENFYENSKINQKCSDINFSKSSHDSRPIKDCSVTIMDVECVFAIPFKELVGDQDCTLEANEICANKGHIGDMTKFCDSHLADNMIDDGCSLFSMPPFGMNRSKTICGSLPQTTMGNLAEFLEEPLKASKLWNPMENSELRFDILDNNSLDINCKSTTSNNFYCETPIKSNDSPKTVVNLKHCERLRHNSECSAESTDSDSFIVFEDYNFESEQNNKERMYGKSENGNIDSEEDDSQNNSENDECDGYDENTSSDEYDYSLMEKHISEANEKWLCLYEDVDDKEVETPKKVKFDSSIKIHKILAWDHAYRTARIGPWEQIARDRVRFQDRIARFSLILSPILRTEHRNKIYAKLHS